MKDGIRGGHSQASPGAVAILNELTEDRIIYPKVIEYLKVLGNEVVNLTPPESYAYPTELQYGINLANKSGLDMGASIHLNAGGGYGVEVVIHDYAKPSTEEAANRVLNNLAALGFHNRGIKRSPRDRKLGEILDTTCSFMIIEVCFVDSQTDADILHRVGYDAVAKAIAEGITGQKLITQTTQTQKEEVDMKKVVLYLGDADVFGAVIVSQKLGCPLMKKADFEAGGYTAGEIIQIGGKPDSNRYTTFKDAAALV